jgi:hypothetical protein
MGFLRPLKGRDSTYEVHRILRSFIDAQWLGQMSEHLSAYAVHAEAEREDQPGARHD